MEADGKQDDAAEPTPDDILGMAFANAEHAYWNSRCAVLGEDVASVAAARAAVRTLSHLFEDERTLNLLAAMAVNMVRGGGWSRRPDLDADIPF